MNEERAKKSSWFIAILFIIGFLDYDFIAAVVSATGDASYIACPELLFVADGFGGSFWCPVIFALFHFYVCKAISFAFWSPFSVLFKAISIRLSKTNISALNQASQKTTIVRGIFPICHKQIKKSLIIKRTILKVKVIPFF